jgi:hypothetical protein
VAIHQKSALASAYLLAIDLDEAMDTELSSLPRAACKESPEDGGVQSALGWVEGHAHVWCSWEFFRWTILSSLGIFLDKLVLSRAPTGSLFRAVVLGQLLRTHGHDRRQVAAEHARPLPLANLLTMVSTGFCFCRPFLLEEGAAYRVGLLETREVVQVVLVPGLPHSLSARGVSKGTIDEWPVKWGHTAFLSP